LSIVAYFTRVINTDPLSRGRRIWVASENLEKALGRAIFDDNFRKKWLGDFDNQSDELDIADVRERIKAEHLLKEFEKYKSDKVSEKKIEEVESKKENNPRITGKENTPVQSGQVQYNEKFKTEQIKLEKESSETINDYTFSVFKQSIEDSRKFLKRITYTGYGIFATGIVFFALAFLSGIGLFGSSFSVTSTLIFGILGVLICGSYFLFDPARRVQLGVSNILKIEMIFLNFWDQVNFWRPYGNSDEDTKKKEASDQMHLAAKTSMEFLQQYLDSNKTVARKFGSEFGNQDNDRENKNIEQGNQT
jgi:hypothetical protein